MSHGAPVVVDDDVRAAQVAVRDPVRAQDRDLLPQRAEERVVDVVAVDGVERSCPSTWSNASSIESVPTSAMARQARRAHADVARLQRHERLVLDRAPQRDERPLVADVLQPEVPVDAEQEVGRALVGAAHLDQEPRAVVEGGEEDARARVRRARAAPSVGDREPGGPRLAAIAAIVGCWSGRPNASSMAAPTAAPDGEGEEHLGRELDREHDAQRHERGEHDRARPVATGTHERAEDHERRGERRRCRSAVNVAVEVDARALGELVGDLLRLRPGRATRRRRSTSAPATMLATIEVAEQPVAPQHERHDEHADARRS